MLRQCACAVFALLLCVGTLSAADEVKGKVSKVDGEKGLLTVKIGEADKEFTVTPDTKVLDNKGKEIPGGLKASAFKAKNISVSVKTDGGKVTEVKLLSAIRKPKDK